MDNTCPVGAVNCGASRDAASRRPPSPAGGGRYAPGVLVRCEACRRTFVRKDDAPGRCPRCGAVEPGPEDAAAAPAAAAPDAVLSEGSAPGAPTRPGKPRRGTIPPAPARFVEGHPSFEDRTQPFARRFFGTVLDVVVHPAAFFTHLAHEGARGVSWFAFLCLLVGHAAAAAWQIVVDLPAAERVLDAVRVDLPRNLPATELKQQLLALAALDAEVAHAMPVAWLKLLLAPITAYFAMHLLSGLVHVGSRAFSTTPEEPVRYDATYRAFCYACAPMLLAVFPVVGGVAVPWFVVVLSLAMAKLHRLRFFGVVGGVLLPVFFLWLLWGAALDTATPALAEALGVHAPARAAPPHP